jgi:hypothetical protein
MEWKNSKVDYPESDCKNEDEIYFISDGILFGIARWANLAKENSEGGHDCDEYDFINLGEYIEPKYWNGPIQRCYACNHEYILMLDPRTIEIRKQIFNL